MKMKLGERLHNHIRFVKCRYPHGRLKQIVNDLWRIRGIYLGRNGLFVGYMINLGPCTVVKTQREEDQ